MASFPKYSTAELSKGEASQPRVEEIGEKTSVKAAEFFHMDKPDGSGWSNFYDGNTPMSELKRAKTRTEAKFGSGIYVDQSKTIDLKVPKPHRCNGHMEDLVVGLTNRPFDVQGPFVNFFRCLFSTPG